jgi:anti-sigma B factor antagonist
MGDFKHIDVTEIDSVTVVRFVDRKILDRLVIEELGQELYSLVEADGRKQLLLNFSNVELLSSEALGKLISLDAKVARARGVLGLCNIRPMLMDVFRITNLVEKFKIWEEQEEALADFASAG